MTKPKTNEVKSLSELIECIKQWQPDEYCDSQGADLDTSHRRAIGKHFSAGHKAACDVLVPVVEELIKQRNHWAVCFNAPSVKSDDDKIRSILESAANLEKAVKS